MDTMTTPQPNASVDDRAARDAQERCPLCRAWNESGLPQLDHLKTRIAIEIVHVMLVRGYYVAKNALPGDVPCDMHSSLVAVEHQMSRLKAEEAAHQEKSSTP